MLFDTAADGQYVMLHGAVCGPITEKAVSTAWAWFWLVTADEVIRVAVEPRLVAGLGPVLSGDGRVRVVGAVDRLGPRPVLVARSADRMTA